jgi:diguanylate cyclase (GGDEF)-like protein
MAGRLRFLYPSLATKLGLAVLSAAVTLSVLAAVVLDHEGRRRVDESTAEHLEVLASALQGSFHVFDADKRAHPVADIVAEIGRHPAVDALQVFDGQGRIRHSLRPQERGQPMPGPVLPDDERAAEGREGGLSMVRMFPPRAECMSCHAGQHTMGGVRLVVDRARIQNALRTFRWQAGLTGAGIIATVLLVVWWLARRLIIRPIQQLVGVMGHAEEGDYLVRAPVQGRDELGALSGAFNKMLAAITDMRAREVENNIERAHAMAQERLGGQLAEKNRIIEDQNTALQQKVRDLTLLQEVTRNLTSTLSLEEQLNIASRLLADTLGYTEFTLMLLDRPAGLLRVVTSHGFPKEMGVRDMTFAVGEGLAGLVAQTGETLLVPDASVDPRYLRDKTRLNPQGSLLCVPMVSGGQVMGVLNVFKPKVNAFKRDEVELLESVTAQAALGIANSKLFQETVEMALTDALTAMPNRRALDARLEVEVARSVRYGTPLSLLMVDVDHFKKYNDMHGHLLGEGVLRAVAQSLCQMVRKSDTVARFGGEEFCVVLPRQDAPSAREVAEKIRRGVRSRPVELGETMPLGCLTVSIGVASCPQDATDVAALVQAADSALYAAKRLGRDRVATASTDGGGTGTDRAAGTLDPVAPGTVDRASSRR